MQHVILRMAIAGKGGESRRGGVAVSMSLGFKGRCRNCSGSCKLLNPNSSKSLSNKQRLHETSKTLVEALLKPGFKIM